MTTPREKVRREEHYFIPVRNFLLKNLINEEVGLLIFFETDFLETLDNIQT